MNKPLETMNQSEQEKVLSVMETVQFIVRYKLGPKNEDWKDLANEVLLAAVLSLREGRFDPTIGTPFKTYVVGITYNKIRAYFNGTKKQKNIEVQANSQYDFFDNEPSRLEQEEYREGIKQILKFLPERYGLVLYLRFLEEMTVEEISQQLGISSERVSERIYYGLKLLRKKYKKEKNYFIFSLILTILYLICF